MLNLEHFSGQEVEVDLEKDVLTDIASGKQYPLKSIGEVKDSSLCLTAQFYSSVLIMPDGRVLLKGTRRCGC